MGGRNTRFYADIEEVHAEVTGSCHLVTVRLPDKNKIKFLVDCGLFQELAYEEFNKDFPFKPEEVEFACLTHDHADHTGRFPMLYHKGYAGKIYCTKQTKALLPISFEDNYKVMKEKAKNKREDLLYFEEDMKEAMKNVVECNYGEAIHVHPNVDIKFLENGHMLGAAMILVRLRYPGEKDIFLLFTGDYKSYNIFFEVEELIDWIKKLPVTIITEATYGDSYTYQNEECFEKNILYALEKKYQTIVLPVFAKGRCQEILYRLKEMQKKGLLSYGIPIYFDGPTAHRYTQVYLKNPEWFYKDMQDFLPKNLRYVSNEEREFILAISEPKILVTTGGMLAHGPIRTYLPELLPRYDTFIHMTGYCAEGTIGRMLLDSRDEDEILLNGKRISKYATIVETGEFSGHGKADDLLWLLQNFTNIQTILINHGETKTKQTFQEYVEKENLTNNIKVMERGYVYRITCYGVTKIFDSKFREKRRS